MRDYSIVLPWPVTINHYYGDRAIKTKTGKYMTVKYLTARAKAFRAEVCRIVQEFDSSDIKESDRLELTVYAYPPDRRIRDLDDILKSLQDSLQHAGVYTNDSQIDILHVYRASVDKPGRVIVSLEEIK